MTVQDWPRRSACLLSDLRYTLMDTGARTCMRLEMRLSSAPVAGLSPRMMIEGYCLANVACDP